MEAATEVNKADSTTTTENPEVTQEGLREQLLSPKFAQLARQQKAFREERERLKKEREAFEAEKKKLGSEYLSKEELRQKFRQNPSEVFEEFEVTNDQLTNLILNGQSQQDPTVLQLMKEVADLKKQLNSESQTRIKTTQEQYDRALAQIKTDAEKLIETEPEYEVLKEFGMSESVVELIKKEYEEKGIVMTVSDACKQVNDHVSAQVEKILSLNKVKEKLKAPAEGGTQAVINETTQAKPKQTTTLTNGVATAKPMTAYERAVLAFKGELKN